MTTELRQGGGDSGASLAPQVLRSGQWVGASGLTGGGGVAVANSPIGVVAMLPAGTYDRIGIGVTAAGAAGKLLRLGCYDVAADGNLGTPRADVNGLPADAVAFVQGVVAIVLPYSGWYWLTAVSDGAPSLVVVTNMAATAGVDPASGTSVGGSVLTGNYAAGPSAPVVSIAASARAGVVLRKA